jgi:hypothetical protein
MVSFSLSQIRANQPPRTIIDSRELTMNYLRYLSKRLKPGFMPSPVLSRFAGPDAVVTPAVMAELVAATRQMKSEGLEQRLDFISRVFVPDHYSTVAGLPAATNGLNSFVHFMKQGLANGVSPSPLFDNDYYDAAISGAGLPPRGNEAAFIHWLDHGVGARIVPTPLFDEAYYLATNPDVEAAALWGFEHFIMSGMDEGRNPHPWYDANWCGKFGG